MHLGNDATFPPGPEGGEVGNAVSILALLPGREGRGSIVARGIPWVGNDTERRFGLGEVFAGTVISGVGTPEC